MAALDDGELRTQASDWSGGTETISRSPGMLPKHYSPKAKLLVLSWRDEADLAQQLKQRGWPRESAHVVAHSQIPLSGGYARVAVLPHDAEAYGRALYAELHQCDQLAARLIVVETPPTEPAWAAIVDRLSRAAG